MQILPEQSAPACTNGAVDSGAPRRRGGYDGAVEAVSAAVGPNGTFGPSLVRAWRAYRCTSVRDLLEAGTLSPWQLMVLEAHYVQITRGPTVDAVTYCTMHDMARAVDTVCPSDSALSLLEENEALRAELARTRRHLAQWRMDREAAE